MKLLYKGNKWRILTYKNRNNPIYKKDDWVVIKSVYQGASGNGIFKDNYIAKLCEIIDNEHSFINGQIEYCTGTINPDWAVFYEILNYRPYNKSYRGIKTSHIIRHATREEIINTKMIITI